MEAGEAEAEEEEENSSDKNLTTLTWQVGNNTNIASFFARCIDTEVQAASRSHHGMFRLGQCRAHPQ